MFRQVVTSCSRAVPARSFSSKVDTSVLDELLSSSSVLTAKKLIPEHSNDNAMKFNRANYDSSSNIAKSTSKARIAAAYNPDIDYSSAIDRYEAEEMKDEFGRRISQEREHGFDLIHYPSRFNNRQNFVYHGTGLRFALDRDALGRNTEDLSEIAEGIEEIGQRTGLANELKIKSEDKALNRHEKGTVFRQRMLRRAKKNRDKGYLIDVLREAIYEPRLFKGDVHWGFYDPLGTPGETYYNWDDKYN